MPGFFNQNKARATAQAINAIAFLMASYSMVTEGPDINEIFYTTLWASSFLVLKENSGAMDIAAALYNAFALGRGTNNSLEILNTVTPLVNIGCCMFTSNSKEKITPAQNHPAQP